MNKDGIGAPSRIVTLDVIDGKEMLVCDCGAKAFPSEYKRFNKRHPALCTARKKLAHYLAQGTRCVDAEESDERIGRRWDAIERALGGEPR